MGIEQAIVDKADLRKPRSRARFEQKREAILDAATTLINQHGVRGATLQDVAAAVGLNTTSVTYYFRRKELLAAAVFEQSLDRLKAMVTEAAREPDARARVARFIRLHIELRAKVLRGAEKPLVVLSDIRTLDEDVRQPLLDRYREVFDAVRSFWKPFEDEGLRELCTARAHMLLEIVFWLPVWLADYAINDFGRVGRRLVSILEEGLAPPGATWRPRLITEDEVRDAMPPRDQASENFLRVATRLINESGYRGASVLRIVEQLNVTKGSFYHHLDAKDDLVLECFRQSYKRVAVVQWLAQQAGGTEWDRLSQGIASLLDIQFRADWPLTRTTALQALPEDLRIEVVRRSNRIALRFNGALVDGARDGTINVTDPLIASQLILSTLNAAYDLTSWAARQPRDRAIAIYASTLANGLFDDRVLDS
ncbi:TetR family transcriptional regulator [Novosphingobium kunmingense]|uniref:TetR family transcriptional regulator n=1 Tax=Novosphingobium kunmingense TaxID=1211806 RepID=A0A2N0HK92_9SPHN|nr:TetR family transcriptional regulator [Novosphingobium kunmingense]PKB19367.1 TetR family transcriptional regulator [Novosphingobium kunmingense]